MKLLLAEDSALLRAGLEQLLAALGHSVTAVWDKISQLGLDARDFAGVHLAAVGTMPLARMA